MEHEVTVKLDQEYYDYLIAASKGDKSAYIRRLLIEDKRRRETILSQEGKENVVIWTDETLSEIISLEE